jgi:hypothetical protein
VWSRLLVSCHLGVILPKIENADQHGCDQRHVFVLTTCCMLGFCWLGFSKVCKSDVSRGLELIDDNGNDEGSIIGSQSHGSLNFGNFKIPIWESWDKMPFGCGLVESH